MKIRNDSLYKFANPYFDEIQKKYTWGIIDLPEPTPKDDDQFYILRENDRLDLIAYQMLGDPRFMFIIMHYNQIADAMDIKSFIGKSLRIPSLSTLEEVYLNAS